MSFSNFILTYFIAQSFAFSLPQAQPGKQVNLCAVAQASVLTGLIKAGVRPPMKAPAPLSDTYIRSWYLDAASVQAEHDETNQVVSDLNTSINQNNDQVASAMGLDQQTFNRYLQHIDPNGLYSNDHPTTTASSTSSSKLAEHTWVYPVPKTCSPPTENIYQYVPKDILPYTAYKAPDTTTSAATTTTTT